MIVDYKEAIKKLIHDTYQPANMVTKEVQKTTPELVASFRNIMPSKQIDEHIIYEALTEMGYTPHEATPLEFYWYFKRKTE